MGSQSKIGKSNRLKRVTLTGMVAALLGLTLILTLTNARQIHAQSTSQVFLNEFMSSNSQTIMDEDGDYSDWVEVVNGGETAVSLTGYGLSDDESQPFRWTFPAITLQPGEYLLVWASSKNRTDPAGPLHTNFAISAAGEHLLLTHPVSGTLDHVYPVALTGDIAYGRQPDATGGWFFFTTATPGASNLTPGYTEILQPPLFSQTGGFFTAPFSLSLSSADPTVEIIYTLDGSIPDPANLDGQTFRYKNQYPQNPGDPVGDFLTDTYRAYVYNYPIAIVNRSALPDELTGKSSTYDLSPTYFPVNPVFKGTVVRARTVKPGALPSPVSTHTFFVASNAPELYSLPVISLSLPEYELFDYDSGFYVAGADFDTWRAANPTAPVGCCPPANWTRDTEYAAHVELFEPDMTSAVLSQDIGVRIHGRSSRAFPFKSLRLYARSEYGLSQINYAFFPDRSYTDFKRLLLRNSGGDYGATLMRDGFIQTLMAPLAFDTQAYRPALLFINGEYWGIHNIRERYDKYYLNQAYRVAEDNIDLLEGNQVVEEGDALHYQATLDYITTHGLQNAADYAYIQTRLDVENFIDYQVAQIYIRNVDWPADNIGYWRTRTADYTPGAPAGQDGRWRWLMYDTDAGFRQPDRDTLTTVSTGTHWATFLFRSLLANPTFTTDFINRFADLLNTLFLPSHVVPMIDQLSQTIAPEIPEHITRWNRPSSLFAWDQNVAVLTSFANQRPAYQRQHILNRFGLAGEFSLTVNVSGVEEGYVRVNTINILTTTAGITAPVYPWTGIYFQGVPIELEAVAQPGYHFTGWVGLPEGTPALTEQTYTTATAVTLTALFEPDVAAPQLLHYWHFNNLPAGTLTAVTADHTLIGGGTITYPGSGAGYMDRVDPGTALNGRLDAPVGYGLRVRNPADTRELILNLPTTGYEQIHLSYAVNRTANGAQEQALYYRTSATNDWIAFGNPITVTESYQLYSFDFSAITAANHNPDFAVRILFGGSNASGASGNNRFDNIAVEGQPANVPNTPPTLLAPIAFQELIEAGLPTTVDLQTIFADSDGDHLIYSASSGATAVVQPSLTEHQLTLIPQQRGEAWLTVTASDGQHAPITTTFRALVYPAAYTLTGEPFTFTAWNPTEPERTYPEHMLFLQSDISDPGLAAPLLYPYYIPHDDYHADDGDVIGFPYNTTGRTRLNGLGEDGLAFINTGRGRDLGGALLAVDTRNTPPLYARWLAGTVLQNSRIYAIRWQYRVGIDGPFRDVLVDGQPVEYVRGANGNTQSFSDIPLPPDALGQPYVQLLWRYYYVSGSSGARAQLRLDDLSVYGSPRTAVVSGPFTPGDLYPFEGSLNCGGVTFTTTGGVQNVTINLTHQFPTANFDGLPRTYTITADGDGFEARLTLCYSPVDLAIANIPSALAPDLHAFRWSGSGWQVFPGTVEMATGTVTAEHVTQFSVWGLGTVANQPTAVTLHDMNSGHHDSLTPVLLLMLLSLLAVTGFIWQRRR